MARKSKRLVGEICLYGTREVGAGYLARVEGKMFGDGAPRPRWSFTDAMFHGLRDIREWGITRGLVRVYEPTGQRFAEVEMDWRWPYYGELKWQPAQQYVIDAEQIIATAE